MMGNPQKFIESLIQYDGKTIPDKIVNTVQPILDLPQFNKESMMKKSSAAGNLCSWVINIVTFNKIYKKVKPLMERAEEAGATAKQKEDELAVVQEKVRGILAKVAELQANLDAAEAKKQAVLDEA